MNMTERHQLGQYLDGLELQLDELVALAERLQDEHDHEDVFMILYGSGMETVKEFPEDGVKVIVCLLAMACQKLADQ